MTDYDVFEGDQHIGRIIWTHAIPKDCRWLSHRINGPNMIAITKYTLKMQLLFR